MGGLVARYYLEVLEGWRDCHALITFGTPYRGAVNALDFIANGYKQMGLNLTAVLRTCPAVYKLFPVYKALKAEGWRRVSEVSVPKAVPDYVAAAAEFHEQIRTAVDAHEADADYLKSRYRYFPFVGVSQPTLQSADIGERRAQSQPRSPRGGRRTTGRRRQVQCRACRQRPSSCPTMPAGRSSASGTHRCRTTSTRSTTSASGSSSCNPRAWVEIRGVWRAGQRPVIGLGLEDLYLPGEPVVLRATVTNGEAPKGLVARLTAARDGSYHRGFRSRKMDTDTL